LDNNKGVQVLIKAFAQIYETEKENHACLSLDIVGNGPDFDIFRNIVTKFKMTSHVTFHGFVDNSKTLYNIYKKSNAFVVPTIYSEGFPRVIDEAMICGLPVICSNIGGMKEGLTDNEVLFCNPGDVGSLCTVLRNLIPEFNK